MRTDPFWINAVTGLMTLVLILILADLGSRWYAQKMRRARRNLTRNCNKETVTRPKEKTWHDGEWH